MLVAGILFDMDGVLLDSRRVVERTWRRWDTPPGLAAGKAAGAKLLGVTTTHRPDQLGHGDYLVPDLLPVRVAMDENARLLQVSLLTVERQHQDSR